MAATTIAVLGGGAFGTAFAQLLGRKGFGGNSDGVHKVSIWALGFLAQLMLSIKLIWS
jgi:glycerol-3-phosphate dehydrogenase